jgi:hypothetical protein
MPESYLDADEQAEKATLSYHPILSDFALADRFGWPEDVIERQRESWLTQIECALMADNMVKGAIHDEGRSKRANARKESQSRDHEDASTKGMNLKKIRQEYDFPEEMPDDVVAKFIGREV